MAVASAVRVATRVRSTLARDRRMVLDPICSQECPKLPVRPPPSRTTTKINRRSGRRWRNGRACCLGCSGDWDLRPSAQRTCTASHFRFAPQSTAACCLWGPPCSCSTSPSRMHQCTSCRSLRRRGLLSLASFSNVSPKTESHRRKPTVQLEEQAAAAVRPTRPTEARMRSRLGVLMGPSMSSSSAKAASTSEFSSCLAAPDLGRGRCRARTVDLARPRPRSAASQCLESSCGGAYARPQACCAGRRQ
eukprot:scaffold57_cov254-Pinguiococcus_pyrenoidosus.AAC.52